MWPKRLKSKPTGINFELKFDSLFDNLSSSFIGNQNIFIATIAMPLAIKKSKLTGSKFELKFVFFIQIFFFFQIIILKEIRTLLFDAANVIIRCKNK